MTILLFHLSKAIGQFAKKFQGGLGSSSRTVNFTYDNVLTRFGLVRRNLRLITVRVQRIN